MGRFLVIHTFAMESLSFSSLLMKKKKIGTSLNICVREYINSLKNIP
jgi:hypothetical protein